MRITGDDQWNSGIRHLELGSDLSASLNLRHSFPLIKFCRTRFLLSRQNQCRAGEPHRWKLLLSRSGRKRNAPPTNKQIPEVSNSAKNSFARKLKHVYLVRNRQLPVPSTASVSALPGRSFQRKRPRGTIGLVLTIYEEIASIFTDVDNGHFASMLWTSVVAFLCATVCRQRCFQRLHLTCNPVFPRSRECVGHGERGTSGVRRSQLRKL